MASCPHPKQGRSPCQPWLTWKWWAGPGWLSAGREQSWKAGKAAADLRSDTVSLSGTAAQKAQCLA